MWKTCSQMNKVYMNVAQWPWCLRTAHGLWFCNLLNVLILFAWVNTDTSFFLIWQTQDTEYLLLLRVRVRGENSKKPQRRERCKWHLYARREKHGKGRWTETFCGQIQRWERICKYSCWKKQISKKKLQVICSQHTPFAVIPEQWICDIHVTLANVCFGMLHNSASSARWNYPNAEFNGNNTYGLL